QVVHRPGRRPAGDRRRVGAVGGGDGADLVALGEHDGVGGAVHEAARQAAAVGPEEHAVGRVAGRRVRALHRAGVVRRAGGRAEVDAGDGLHGAAGGGAVGGADEHLDDVRGRAGRVGRGRLVVGGGGG